MLELSKAIVLYNAWLWIPNIALIVIYGTFTLLGIENSSLYILIISLGVGKKPRAKKTGETPAPAAETKKTN